MIIEVELKLVMLVIECL